MYVENHEIVGDGVSESCGRGTCFRVGKKIVQHRSV
jgi:hypothetical protein